jgi:hypothetical protein
MRDRLFRIGMLFYKYAYWHPLERITYRPAMAQMDVIKKILYENRNTRFGVECDFYNIHNYADYKKKVPIQQYEMLRPYIEEQRRQGRQALTAESPLFYSQTSGTTGDPKYIPVTSTALKLYRKEQSLFSYLQYKACPEAFSGKALGIMGAAVEGVLDSGHQVGSISGRLYQSLPKMIRSRFVLPPGVSTIENYDLKYLVILTLALAEKNITYAGSPNPSTFLRLLNLLNSRRGDLTESIATGRFREMDALEPTLRIELEQLMRPDPLRASYIDSLPELSFSNVWPNLALVTTWMGGSCGIALNTLRDQLPKKTKVMELGYQSTEFRGSIALDTENNAGLPPLHHHFFEFVEQEKWDDNHPEFLMLDEIEKGKLYYVIITTVTGLYRYFMNDLVEVTGYFNATPLLRFIQKGKGVTSLTGEKLYESQVISAVRNVYEKVGLSSSFYILVADEREMAYRLYSEVDGDLPETTFNIAAMIDEKLGEFNLEYQAKRVSKRLSPLTVNWLKRGTSEAYKDACVRSGQREGQYKLALLQYRENLKLSLVEFCIR